MSSKVPREVFAALERARPHLLDLLAGHGVRRIEFVAGFVEPYSVSVWLGTETDAERDVLPVDHPFREAVRQVLDSAGLPHGQAQFNGTVAQSQETVDREYEGSWFYALR